METFFTKGPFLVVLPFALLLFVYGGFIAYTLAEDYFKTKHEKEQRK